MIILEQTFILILGILCSAGMLKIAMNAKNRVQSYAIIAMIYFIHQSVFYGFVLFSEIETYDWSVQVRLHACVALLVIVIDNYRQTMRAKWRDECLNGQYP